MHNSKLIIVLACCTLLCGCAPVAETAPPMIITDIVEPLQTIPLYDYALPTVDPEEYYDYIEYIYIGDFKLTAYCSCRKCCGKWANSRPKDAQGNDIVLGAAGSRLTQGVSIAVDPAVIPYGSVVVFNEQSYIAHDTGGNIKGFRIDVYFDSHEQARQFGVVATVPVYLIQ